MTQPATFGNEIHRRIYELRFEGDRTISGTAMQYGDVAELPWGRERFERGAFGAVEDLDVILNLQHDRGRPVSRSDGAGLMLNGTSDALRVRAELAETADGNDALVLVQGRILRGLSVEFRVTDWRFEDEDLFVVEKAELTGIGLVDKPAYKQSTIDRYRAMVRSERGNHNPQGGDADMTPDEIRALVAEMISTRGDSNDEALAEQIAERVAGAVDTDVEQRIAAALETAQRERDEAEEARQQAEADREAAETQAAEERAEFEANALARADLIVRCRELLPDEFEVEGADRHAILVAAVGEEVEGAEERSADYLEARLEGILERREEADRQLNSNQNRGRKSGSGSKVGDIKGVAGSVNVVQMRQLAKARARRATS